MPPARGCAPSPSRPNRNRSSFRMGVRGAIGPPSFLLGDPFGFPQTPSFTWRATPVATTLWPTYSRRPMRSRLALVAVVAALACGCGQPASDPLVERGRQVYLAQCTQCHNPDPSQDGALGPAVKGSSRELLEARILRG